MKAKKLPRRIQAYLILQGLFFGQVIGTGTLAFTVLIMDNIGLGFLLWIVVTMGLWGIWMYIAFKYKDSLADWGLVDKPKKGEKEG